MKEPLSSINHRYRISQERSRSRRIARELYAQTHRDAWDELRDWAYGATVVAVVLTAVLFAGINW